MNHSYTNIPFIKYLLIITIVTLVFLTLNTLVFPKLNYRPMPAGLCDSTYASNKAGWVSSLLPPSDKHYIAPLKQNSLSQIAAQIKTAQVVDLNTHFLTAYRQHSIFAVTDWMCVRSDGAVTSTSTMGYYDFGRNRQWVESVRAHV